MKKEYIEKERKGYMKCRKCGHEASEHDNLRGCMAYKGFLDWIFTGGKFRHCECEGFEE